MLRRIYPYFDFHCDTLTQIYKEKEFLNYPEMMISVNHLKKYSPAVQTFSIFNDGTLQKKDIISHIEYLKHQCNIFSGMICFAKNSNDIKNNTEKGIASAMLSIEALGNQKDFEPENIYDYNKCGIRIMGLCHNDDNILCGGIGSNDKGLTALGRKTLRYMQRYGVILDVSHMSDMSFWDAVYEYSLPLAATHSNSRSVCNNNRNITDAQFVTLAKRGGICGVNYYPLFTGDDDVLSVVRHIEHFVELGGENNICLGSDFDGIPKTVTGIENAGLVYRIFDTLLSLNYNESLINKIAFNNFHNFLRNFETLR